MKLKQILLWIIGLATLTFAIIWLGFDEIANSIRQVNPRILALLFIIQILTLIIPVLQWQYLLKKSNQYLSPGLIMAITLAGNYVESVTPAVKLGGEAAKVYLFNQYSNLGYDCLTGILLTLKLYSILPFVLLSGIFAGSAFINFDMPKFVFIAFIILLLFFMGICLIYLRAGKSSMISIPSVDYYKNRIFKSNCIMGYFCKIFYLLEKYLAKALAFINRSAIFARSMTNRSERVLLIILSTLVWVTYPLKVYLVVDMLSLEVGLFSVAVITYTAYLISMVPLLPGGLGSFEATMVMMFSLYGLNPAEGLAVALISRLVTYWFPLGLSAFAAVFLTLGKAVKSKRNLGEKSDQDCSVEVNPKYS